MSLKLEEATEELPDSWEMVKLGDICDLGGGKTPRKSTDEYWGGETNWVSPKDFNGTYISETEDKLTKTALDDNSITVYEPDSIAIVVRSGVLKHTLPVAQLEKPATVNQDIKVLQPDKERIRDDYLLAILSYESDRIRTSCAKTGTTVESIETSFLEAYEIPVPPLPEQRRIAAVLSTVDEGIRQTEEIIETTEELKRGLRQDLVTNGIEHQEYQETKLGPKIVEIPQTWDVEQVGEVSEIVTGSTPDTDKEEFYGGDIAWVTPTDITSTEGAYLHDTERKLTQEGLDSCSATVMEPGAVLVTTRATIGATAINTVAAATNQGFKSLVPGDRLHTEYLYYYINSIRGYLEALGGGSTFPEVNKRDMTNLRVPIPPIEEQRKIAEIISEADEKTAREKEQRNRLQELKRALMQDLLTGEVRTPSDLLDTDAPTSDT